MSSLKRTPLYDLQRQSGARMVAFAGWEMPVQYSGLSHEHRTVRSAVGLFDISHMGKYWLRGPGLLAGLERLVPSRLGKLQAGQAQYTLLLNPQAGILDDVIFYCQGLDRWALIVNGATNEKDGAWLRAHLPGIAFEDRTLSHTLLALQGPAAAATLQPLTDLDLAGLGRFGHAEVQLAGQPAFVARTGYTGEDGFEILTSADDGQALWQRLLDLGVLPCGLGARDTLRLEAAMHLYGQDMDEATTPLEASLGWVIDWEKPDFLGRDVLLDQKENGTLRRLVGFEVQGREIARPGYGVFAGGVRVGQVTSGTLSPTLEQPIGLAYVPPELAKVGTELHIAVRDKQVAARVVKRPFYRRAL
ncbi:glycine cleavage system aminomethyltransferase GcvT [Gloeobacter kilaueensis]|uniref:Aminomethyltransferase n=1 Tax=Gloeobacter kilaueensis (strain ATCC BAA-2537 / CCAP 1431/1 / ULC 316 / JS1) TaxID=1183438 RepID=U5QCY0_GLOK1|nr:glycine cleavage system aminomethyltransferase GcvT [Gloeobacter kilaueensis]AGY56777.1 glycine cleavage system aminomethyltransferase T [Gloeobacter kilaueensis JS1]